MNKKDAPIGLVLLLELGLTASYPKFQYWWSSLKSQLFVSHPDLTKIFAPTTLVPLIILVSLGRIIWRVDIGNRSRDWKIGLFFLACAVIATPAVVYQRYMVSDNGKVADVEDIGVIATAKPASYYTLKRGFIDKTHAVSYWKAADDDLRMSIVAPIRVSESDTSQTIVPAWIGAQYQYTITDKTALVRAQDKYDFYTKALDDFSAKDLAHVACLRRIIDPDSVKAYLHAIQKSPLVSATNPPMIFGVVSEPVSRRDATLLAWTVLAGVLGAAVWVLSLKALAGPKTAESWEPQ